MDVDGALRARGPEAVGVADDPAGQVAPVAPPHHAEALGIEEVEPAERLVEPRHHVGVVPAAPVADDRARERLAVAPAAARVQVHDGVPRAGVDLELVEEAVAVLGGRATVDVEEGRVAPARLAGRPAA